MWKQSSLQVETCEVCCCGSVSHITHNLVIFGLLCFCRGQCAVAQLSDAFITVARWFAFISLISFSGWRGDTSAKKCPDEYVTEQLQQRFRMFVWNIPSIIHGFGEITRCIPTVVKDYPKSHEISQKRLELPKIFEFHQMELVACI